MKKIILFSISCWMFSLSMTFAQASPVGIWKTVDDKTGETRSQVEIYEQNGQFFGKIIKLLQKPADTVCEECKGDKKNQPVVGMVIIEGVKPHKDYWKNGTILDPESGNEYACSFWFEDNNTDALKLRGKHWTGLYRTQTWFRVK